MCTLCDSTDINTIIEFVPYVDGDGFNGGSDSYLQFRDTHAPCILKLCIPPSNGIVRWWLFHEFAAELQLDNCTPTIILNNPVYNDWVTDGQQQHTLYNFPFRVGQQRHVKGHRSPFSQNNSNNLYEPKRQAVSLFIWHRFCADAASQSDTWAPMFRKRKQPRTSG